MTFTTDQNSQMDAAKDARPAKYHAFPPYSAQDAGVDGPCGLYGVFNRNGVNVLTFKSKPGAVFTSDKTQAEQIAKTWNESTAQ